MSRLLVLYETSEGHTAQIAERIADRIRSKGHEVAIVSARHLPPDFFPVQYEAIIIGAPIHRDQYPKSVARFVEEHRAFLNKIPSAFFTACLTVSSGRHEDLVKGEKYANDFLKQTAWSPTSTAVFAGALLYTQYGFIKRFMLKKISERAGGDTDTSKDYDYTDWKAVDVFADDFLAAAGDALKESAAR
ncbi:MAG TPA: flavodoxin domain-containing protein [Chloroflexia bacterium]|nr:flavodoxin domain-containing protein [Chloroflexia bacterium]